MAIWGCAWAWIWVLSNCTVGLFSGLSWLLERLSITFTSKGKREFVPRDQVSSWACRLRFIISTRNLVVSRNFLSIRIVLSFFYQPVSYFEKCLTWIWRLPFAVYGKRKVSIKRFSRKLGHNLCPKTVPCATSKQPIQLVLNFSTNVTALWSQNKKGSHLWPSMFRLNVMVNLSILTEFVEWEKNKHFKTPALVSSPTDVCSTSAKIPSITMTCHYSDLGSVCFNQSEAALPSVVKYFESYF